MDVEQMESWKRELNLKRIKNQYEETENVVEVVDNFQCHLERISKLSSWQKQFIDVEILKLVNTEKKGC